MTEYGKVKFYSISATRHGTTVDKVYADVDSSNVKRYFSFYPDRIVMTDEREKGLSYTILFRELPGSYDTTIFHQLSFLDKLVLSQARLLLNTTEFAHLKNPKGATCFEIEVNYLHGFPKHRKFKPL
ncbi:hypothetical protein FPE01S_01_07880 [Flavihumibacter petaseus NBRC 106054]|uniref:Uncharacterized protein n=1 Tax=Flavihumibacter petaseus NBRC 106054 TaxID=1220578 RepID=A0A0E9MW03_9BACT|nr:hypothetical protein FPE01S_01_07880 [Flavihumibacter petaseus NBRC 106054]